MDLIIHKDNFRNPEFPQVLMNIMAIKLAPECPGLHYGSQILAKAVPGGLIDVEKHFNCILAVIAFNLAIHDIAHDLKKDIDILVGSS